MEEMVVDPCSGRDRPAAARKRLSSSVTSEAADSESDVRSDDSDAFVPAKHRRSRRKSTTSSSSEETVIYNTIVTTTVAYVPVDVTVSLNAISKQKLHDFFFKLAPGLIQEVRVNPRKNIIAVDTTDEKTVQTLLGAPSHDNVFQLVRECLQQATVRRLRSVDKPNPDLKLLRLRACRRRAYRRAQRSKRSSDWTLYNRLDAAIRRHTKQHRRRSWAALCSSLDAANGFGSVWRILKALRTPERQRKRRPKFVDK
ncbi:hypothetical protein HPB52_014475 [Rhipicephalus sanguineus]|uniref:Uncharacterized protein n=1 Tax=Rhipicephalus sanguineus TaxID=34632 RepID=A0A9D4T699_RHISA|nr:hypothetical protein HPB52_014475 [Rhipicephalus sanguineus]